MNTINSNNSISKWVTAGFALLFLILCGYAFHRIGGHTEIFKILSLAPLKQSLVLAFLLFLHFIFLKNSRFKNLPYLLPIFLLFFSGALEGALGLLIVFLTSFVFGSAIIDLFKISFFKKLSNLEQIFISYFFGISALGFINWLLIGLPIHTKLSYFCVCTLALIIWRKKLKFVNDSMCEVFKMPWTKMGYLIFFISCTLLAYALAPVYGFDELEMYYHIPKLIAKHGYFKMDLNFVANWFPNVSCFPVFTIPYLIGGEFACRLFILSFFVTGLVLTRAFTNRVFGEKISFFSCLCLSTTPFFVGLMGRQQLDFYDLGTGAVLLILFYEIYKSTISSDQSKASIVFCLMSIFAFLIRLQSAVIISSLGLGLIYLSIKSIRREKSFQFFRGILIGGVLFLAILSPGLIRNFINTGNPVFPLFNHVFKSPYFHDFSLMAMPLGTVPSFSWNTLIEITFNFTQQYLYFPFHQFGLGFLYYLFLYSLPFILLRKKTNFRKTLFGLTIIFLISFFVYHQFYRQIRYLTSALPLASLIIGICFVELKTIFKDTWFSKVFISLTVFFSILGISLMPQGVGLTWIGFPPPFKQILTQNYENHILQYWINTKKFFTVANGMLSKDDKVLMYYSPANYLADFNVEQYDWYFYETQQKLVEAKEKSPEEIYDTLFLDLKYDALLLTHSDLFGMVENSYLEKKYNLDNYTLWRPKQKFQFNKKILFGIANMGEFQREHEMLTGYWQAPEQNIVWSAGLESKIKLEMPRYVNTALQVELCIVPLIKKDYVSSQRISIKLENESLYQKTLESPQLECANFAIPSEKNTGDIEISIEHPDAKKASEIGLSPEDHRVLAIQLHSLKIEKGDQK